MKLKGKVFSGPGRGGSLITKWEARLIRIIGFRPFRGTLNVRLEEPVDLKSYATKFVEHVMIHGKKNVEAYLVAVKLIYRGGERDCWAIRDTNPTYGDNVVDLLHEKKLKDDLGMKDGDEVEIEFPGRLVKRTKVPGFGIIQKMMQSEHRNSV